MSSSSSPCAACKLQRRKCTQECVFAPYFPPDEPEKFAKIHKVFGASNVAKLINELNVAQREDAVKSLAYEAEYRLRDPVYGCVGLISILKQRLEQVQSDLFNAKKELSSFIGPTAMLPMLPQPGYVQQHPSNPSSSSVIPFNMSPMLGLQTGQVGPLHGSPLVIREPQQQQQQHHPHHHHHHHHQQQQMLEAQQIAAAVAAREQQEMMRSYEQQQHQHQQHDLVRFSSGFDPAGTVTASGFNQMTAAAVSPSLALGPFDNPYQIQQQQQEHPHHHLQLQSQLLLQPQQQQQQPLQSQHQQRSGSEERRSVGPS